MPAVKAPLPCGSGALSVAVPLLCARAAEGALGLEGALTGGMVIDVITGIAFMEIVVFLYVYVFSG